MGSFHHCLKQVRVTELRRLSSNWRPGVRHSTFESLRLGFSSQSIASGFLRFWDSLNFKKDREFVGITVLFLDENVNFVIHGFTPVGRANLYMPSLKANSIVKVDRFENSPFQAEHRMKANFFRSSSTSRRESEDRCWWEVNQGILERSEAA
uniref:Uncharacterized protein n=1 Tax=Brassica oleracea TaxID=3712 RepID=A0A3P6EYI2_BRAOL|nr:unnamed protein product [Brassica oleracea]